MLDYISSLLDKEGMDPNFSEFISNFLGFLILLLVVFAIRYIVVKIIYHIINPYKNRRKFRWLAILEKQKFFDRISNAIPLIAIYCAIPSFSGKYQGFLNIFAYVYLIIAVIGVVDSILDSISRAYDVLLVNKNKPIKGFIQILDIVVYVAGGVVIISKLIGKSPTIILSGLGAVAAIFSIVFKDTLLGFVASIQISANNLINIGDWIEIPDLKVGVSVLDISLTAIKLKNSDGTITTIHPYTLISNAFKNWRNVDKVGARLIQTSVYIDVSSIEFCTTQMLERFKKMDYLSDYIIKKQIDMEHVNKENQVKENDVLLKKSITNIEIFREYIKNYLKHNLRINSEMTILVRQLDVTQNGVPLEVYTYSNTANWEATEIIKSDIIDHIIALAPEFGLKLYQIPSGNDFRK